MPQLNQTKVADPLNIPVLLVCQCFAAALAGNSSHRSFPSLHREYRLHVCSVQREELVECALRRFSFAVVDALNGNTANGSPV